MKKLLIFSLIMFLFCSKERVEKKIDVNKKGAFSLILIKKDPADPLKSKEKIDKIYREIVENKITFEDGVKSSDLNPLFIAREGFIGIQRFGQFVLPVPESIEDSIFKLKEGEISSVIELPNDFAILKRETIMEDKALNHMLISWKGALHSPIAIQRTKEQALKMAEEALKLLKEGFLWKEIAKKYSNGLEAKRGGYLGLLSPKALFPEHRESVLKLDYGQISPILESPLGFHIYQMTKPWVDVIGLKHIMIAYQGALMAPFTITRSKEEAKELAENLRKRLIDGENFEKIAKKYSNDKSTYKNGGDLGLICIDKFIPIELEEIAFNLGINEISQVVESPGGYHILLRYK